MVTTVTVVVMVVGTEMTMAAGMAADTAAGIKALK
jgi:hypothetical protein